MKNRYLAVFLGIYMVSAIAAKAQEALPVNQHPPDKPFIFSQLPDRSNCTMAALQELFLSSPSDIINFKLSNGTVLRGVVTEKIQRSPGLTSLNIKLSDFPGALFNLSMNVQPGLSPVINGRIIHPGSGDVLVLTLENNQYFLQKKLQKYFMTE